MARVRNHVWGIGKVACEDAHRVWEGSSIAMQQTHVVFNGANGKQRSRNAQTGRTQVNLAGSWWRGQVKLADPKRWRPHPLQPPDLLGHQDLSFIPPAPEFESRLSHCRLSCCRALYITAVGCTMLEDGVSDALRAKLLANCPILNCFDSGCFPPEVLSARHALAGPLPTLISSEHR